MCCLISRSQRCRAVLAAIGLCAVVAESSAQEPSSLSETYGSWTVHCRTAQVSDDAGTRRICQVSQELVQPETGKRIISSAYTMDPPKITFITPLGLLLREGVGLSVDKRDLPVASFTTCLASVGCVAELELESDDLSALQSSQTLTVLMVNRNGQKLQANLSLDGFSDAAKRFGSIQ